MGKLIIITAPRNRGKTTAMWQKYRETAGREGVKAGGYITKLDGPEDSKSGFTLIELHTGREIQAVSEHPPQGEAGWNPMGKRYWFSSKAFDRACRFYREAGDFTHLFMDEVGKFEFQGGGYDPAVQFLQNSYQGTLYVAVRDVFIDEYLEKYDFGAKWTLSVDEVPEHSGDQLK